MGERHAQQVTEHAPGRAGPPGAAVRDAHWAGAARCAAGCAALLLTLLLAVDAVAGGLGTAHTALWTALAALLFAVLLPARVSAAPGRLVSCGLLRERSVRTDRLVSLRWSEGVSQRLVLRDTDGGRVELDARVLLATPELWHRLDEDARVSLRNGTLRWGAPALRRLEARLDTETARLVLRRSELG
jgi:hypothetical protein